MVAAVQPSHPPLAPSLTPEERVRVEAYRAQFRAMGMTDEEIDHPFEPVSPERQAAAEAWERGEGPWPFDR